jgi:hypothetical protein
MFGRLDAGKLAHINVKKNEVILLLLEYFEKSLPGSESIQRVFNLAHVNERYEQISVNLRVLAKRYSESRFPGSWSHRHHPPLLYIVAPQNPVQASIAPIDTAGEKMKPGKMKLPAQRIWAGSQRQVVISNEREKSSPADGIGTFLKPALPPRLAYHTPMRPYHLFLMTRVAAAGLDFSLHPYGLRSK